MQSEQWKRWIPPRKYGPDVFISDQGNVCGRAVFDHGDGYLVFASGGPKLVHQAVLELFVGPRKEGQVARHLNGDKRDNRVTNLQWGTVEENHEDAMKHGTHVAAKDRKFTEDQVRWIRGFDVKDKHYLAAVFDVNYQTIHDIISNKSYSKVK